MVIEFDKEYLRELYFEGKCKDKNYRYQPQVVRKYIDRIKTLYLASKIDELIELRSLNYEKLKGDKKGISSIRIDQKYRLEFRILKQKREIKITICTILDISNHYE